MKLRVSRYRHRDRIIAENKPVLNLAIVMNVLQDEAYLFLEPSAPLLEEDEILMMTGTDTLRLGTQNRESYLEFASQIYEGIQEGASFQVSLGDAWEPILEDKDEREVFRITTSDYYRLTRIY